MSRNNSKSAAEAALEVAATFSPPRSARAELLGKEVPFEGLRLKVKFNERADSPYLQMVIAVPQEKGPTKYSRRQTGTDDYDRVLALARAFAIDQEMIRYGGVSGIVRRNLEENRVPPTWAEAFAIFREKKLPELNQKTRASYEVRLGYLEQIVDLDQRVTAVTSLDVGHWNRQMNEGMILREKDKKGNWIPRPVLSKYLKKNGEPQHRGPLARNTARDAVGMLGSVVEVARKATANEHGVPFFANRVWELAEYWPEKPEDDGPVMSEVEFEKLLAVAPLKEARNKVKAWTPKGWIAAMLWTFHSHGRRRNQVRWLRMRDIILVNGPDDEAGRERLRNELRNRGLGAKVEWADAFKWGAIFYDRATLKQARKNAAGELRQDYMKGRLRGHMVPVPLRLYEVLRDFLSAHPGKDDPMACLFPNHNAPSEPITLRTIRSTFLILERLAGLTHTPYGGWHALRRKFRSDRAGFPPKLLQIIAGWSTKSSRYEASMDQSYLQFMGPDLQAAVEFWVTRDRTPGVGVSDVHKLVHFPPEYGYGTPTMRPDAVLARIAELEAELAELKTAALGAAR